MSIKRVFFSMVGIIILSFSLIGCSNIANANLLINEPQSSMTPLFTSTASQTPFPAITNTPIIIPPSYTPTSTSTPSLTSTPLPTETPVATQTLSLVFNPAGHVVAPILLYHHVSDSGNGNRYYVSVDTFKTQMEDLLDWGYTSITVSQLVDVLINGGDLPSRPVLITFDDGNIDIYQNAFPIMHDLGFVGTTYIIANRLGAKSYVNVDQLKKLVNDGWEIGSHSMSHPDLTIDYSIARFEILQSRLTLEDATGDPVKTFAYPYGKTDEYISTKVSDYGYRAGMGLGTSWEHTLGTLFYLSRIEVQGSYDISKFASLLPWSDQ